MKDVRETTDFDVFVFVFSSENTLKFQSASFFPLHLLKHFHRLQVLPPSVRSLSINLSLIGQCLLLFLNLLKCCPRYKKCLADCFFVSLFVIFSLGISEQIVPCQLSDPRTSVNQLLITSKIDILTTHYNYLCQIYNVCHYRLQTETWKSLTHSGHGVHQHQFMDSVFIFILHLQMLIFFRIMFLFIRVLVHTLHNSLHREPCVVAFK